jgi:hypothetical protein
LSTIRGKGINWLKAFPAFYLLISSLLSITVFYRFFMPSNQIIKLSDYSLYLVFFSIVPVMCAIYLLVRTLTAKCLSRLQLTASILLAGVWLVSITAGFMGRSFPFEYLYIWITVPTAYVFSARWNKNGRLNWSKKLKIFAIACFAVAIIMPNIVTLFGMNYVVGETQSLINVQDKVSYIDYRVNALTTYTWHFRANLDNWKFLLSGAGQCGEMALLSNIIMQSSAVTSRIVGIPGEHAFVEVKVNDDWMVADGSTLINRTAFGERRINDVGSLSYALSESADSFIELTQYYVPTDTVIINVTRNGEPVADASIVLVRSGTLSAILPSTDRTFHTDVNGETLLHLGKANFVREYQGTDTFYIIYVDGAPTKYNVTSTGTGLTKTVNVAL